jgi:hypothetical protein
MLQKDNPSKHAGRGRSDDLSALVGPDALSGDMSGEDIAFVLREIRQP